MMDIHCNELDVRVFTGELDKCESVSLVNSSEPTKIIRGINGIKDSLLSLKLSTKKVINSYKRNYLFEKVTKATSDFRIRYEGAKVNVHNLNARLSILGADRESSLDSFSEMEDQFVAVEGSPHHNKYHSKQIYETGDDPEVEPAVEEIFQSRRTSSRLAAPTRLTLENRENLAKKTLLKVLRTPEGMIHESSVVVRTYICSVKEIFLVYREVYLDFRIWLSTHGYTDEQSAKRRDYASMVNECNHVIRKINEILEERESETCSVVGSSYLPTSYRPRTEVQVLKQSVQDYSQGDPKVFPGGGTPLEGIGTMPDGSDAAKGAIIERYPWSSIPDLDVSINQETEKLRECEPTNDLGTRRKTVLGNGWGHPGNMIEPVVSGDSFPKVLQRPQNDLVLEHRSAVVPEDMWSREDFGKPLSRNSRVSFRDTLEHKTANLNLDYSTSKGNDSTTRLLYGVKCKSSRDPTDRMRHLEQNQNCQRPSNHGPSSYPPRVSEPTASGYGKEHVAPASRTSEPGCAVDVNSVVRGQIRSDLYKGMMDPFDGSPERFWSWKTRLQGHLREAACNPSDTIHIILRNTTGRPKSIVQDYLDNCYEDPESTLFEVWRELEKRFGSESLVSTCLLDKINEFEKIEKPTEVHKMEKLLSLCRSVRSKMKSCHQLGVLNYRSQLRTIWEKMPTNFQTNWLKKSIRLEQETGKSPTLNDLFDAISAYIDLYSHPDFNPRKNTVKQTKVLQTFVSPPPQKDCRNREDHGKTESGKYCIYHEVSGHDLLQCYQFKRLKYLDRKSFVSSKKLCFSCLQPHFISNCPGNVECTQCGGPHLDLMHKDAWNPNGNYRNPDYRGGPQSYQSHGLNPVASGPSQSWSKTLPNQQLNYGAVASGINGPPPSVPQNWVPSSDARQGPIPGSGKLSQAVAAPNQEHRRAICTMVCGIDQSSQKCCSKTLPIHVRVSGETDYVTGYCILDEQSNTSFCDSSLPFQLHLSPPKSTYSLSTMSGYKTKIEGSIVRGLEVRGISEERWIALPELLTHPAIPDTTSEVATRKIVDSHPHISHLSSHFPVAPLDCNVLLLLGVNCGEAMYTEPHGSTYPYAHHTALGWCLVGPVCRDFQRTNLKALRTSVVENCEHFSAKNCFSQKSEGDLIPRDFDISSYSPEDEFPGRSKYDQKFLVITRSGISPNAKGNFEMPLPLVDNSDFPDNRRAVYMRTKNTLLRIKRDEPVLSKCIETMQTYIDAGHVQQLDPTDHGIRGRTNHLNIFPVTHAKKPGKVRMVFDGSARLSGVCLNDKLLRGPDVANRLIGVLLRFRLRKVSFAADIECMFHSFYVSPCDRDILRFFWFSKNDPSNELATYRANVHIFGNKSSPALATFGLRFTTTDEDAKTLTKAKDFILNNFYVDDGMGSEDTEEEAIQTLKDTRKILSKFNIRLHKIMSPSSRVLAAFPESELATDLKTLDISKNPSQSALGVAWNLESDSFNLKYAEPRTDFTRRAILSVNGSVYDPLGIASPVSLGGRILQRKFISSGSQPFGWDDPLPEEYLAEWKSWLSQLPQITELSIPRCMFLLDGGKLLKTELHIFCDASKDAIGHIIYVRSIYDDGQLHVSFLFANSKVAPRSANTIPRLELCAAVEAAQSAAYVSAELSELKFDSARFYSDSMVVLGYITNKDRAFSKYVESRVSVILRHTLENQWQYVSTSENPADLATRPQTPSDLKSSKWFTGPSFLLSRIEVDSFEPLVQPVLPECLAASKVMVTNLSVVNPIIQHLATRFSSWNSVIKTVGYIFGFVAACRKSQVSMDVFSESVAFVVREVQAQEFPDEYRSLRRGEQLHSSSSIVPLSPFLDADGIIRVGGRLHNADLPYHEKHPRLLPAGHRVTYLLAVHAHELSLHQGRHITTAYVRHQGYHIHKMRKVITRLLSDCVTCRRLRGALETQKMADLPEDRLEKVPPFMRSGVDVFGPYYVYDGKSTRRNNATKKVWVVLFTCLYSRAVHLEPISSMDITSLKLALRRFTAVRGHCNFYRSDCGTNFVGAENQLKVSDLSELVSENSQISQPEWKFLPPYASHFAGVWERKVGSIKKVLNASFALLGNRSLSREEFCTLIQEAGHIVNNTPLGSISANANDPFPPTPASLLTLRDGVPSERECFTEDDLLSYGRKRYRRIQYLADQFWIRWRDDYLHGLQTRRKWTKPKRNVCSGDVVLIKDASPRNNWPMGLVTDTKANADGLIRSVTIKLKPITDEKSRFVNRAIHDLVILLPKDSNAE